MRLINKLNRTYYYEFDGVKDMTEQVSGKRLADRFAAWDNPREAIGFAKLSVEELRQLVDSPWKKGLDIIERFRDQLKNAINIEVKSHQRKVRFNEDDGDEVDLDRLRCGQLYWRESRREEATGPTELTVFFDCGGNCRRANEEFMWRGAAALAIVDILESRGYRVELWQVKGVTADNGDRFVSGTCLKRTSDPCDQSSLAMAISGWFFRTVGICSNWAEADVHNVYLGDGSGRSFPPTQADLDQFSKDKNRVSIMETWNFNAALAVVQHELQKLNDGNN